MHNKEVICYERIIKISNGPEVQKNTTKDIMTKASLVLQEYQQALQWQSKGISLVFFIIFFYLCSFGPQNPITQTREYPKRRMEKNKAGAMYFKYGETHNSLRGTY